MFGVATHDLSNHEILRGVSKKFVHLRYLFLTTKDIEMILGDLLLWCISSSGGKY